MPTGSGKTLVAIARIRHELETSLSTRLIWFLAPSVALARQQYDVLKLHLGSYSIISLTGDDGVDSWSDQRLWDGVLSGVHVVVGTPAVLKDALMHAFVRISRLALLVFDECHHCIANDPMNAIMRNFYHTNEARGGPVPYILGLTASPAINAKDGSLRELQQNLHAIVASPRRELEDLMRFVHPPRIIPIPYSAKTVDRYPGSSRVSRALDEASQRYDLASDPYVIELLEARDDRSRHQLENVLRKKKTICSDQLSRLNRSAEELYDQLGAPAAESYIVSCATRFCSGVRREEVLIYDATVREQRHLMAILNGVVDLHASDLPGSPQGVGEHSAKVEELINLLIDHASPSVRAIVFVRQRATATALSDLLGNTERLRHVYHVGGFVGSSSFERRKRLSDLADLRQQQYDLEDFREGKKNLLVATSVLEEGIDVSACNLIINFDAPNTFIAFLQRRGRARQERSHYYILLPEADLSANLSKWEREEEKMKREYETAHLQRTEANMLDQPAVEVRTYQVESTGAMITMNDAKAHLYHFCATAVPGMQMTADSRPDFYATQSRDDGLWYATVTLPSYIHPDVRVAHSSCGWHGEDAASKDAAFEAYVSLHKAGLLNDNLLPLHEERLLAQGEHQGHHARSCSVGVLNNPWLEFAGAIQLDAEWHRFKVNVRLFTGAVLDVWGILPASLRQPDTFTLHWSEHHTCEVNVETSEASDLSPSQRTHLCKQTQILLGTIHGSRLKDDGSTDLCLLFDTGKVLRAGHVAAVDFFRAHALNFEECGLIHTVSQGTLPFSFRRLTGPRSLQAEAVTMDSATALTEVIVTRFPKRTDFLHPLPKDQPTNEAYTREEVFPLDECTVDCVPHAYAVFAALVPSITHKIELRLLAQELQATILEPIHLHNLDLILEAMCAPSAVEGFDYNRLEFLGDSILGFCTAIQAMAQYPMWPQGYLDRKKSAIVNNHTLSTASLALGLDKFILTRTFTGRKWRPIYASEVLAAEVPSTRDMSTKTLADVVEALVGAAFVEGGLGKASLSIRTLLPEETWYPETTLFDTLTPSNDTPVAIQPEALVPLEEQIGHHFHSPVLLIEAITHASLPFQRTGMSYERLEFLGDGVLDLILVPKLFAHRRRLKAHQLHGVKETLVNGNFLAYCCMQLGREQTRTRAIKDGNSYTLQSESRTVHLYDFLRANESIMKNLRSSVEAFTAYHDTIEQTLVEGKEYPWLELTLMAPRKFISDIVESILGALYIDSRGDLEVCERFLERLGIFKYMDIILESGMEVMSLKERVGILAGNQTVAYVASDEEVGHQKTFGCCVRIGEREVAHASGCQSRAEAEVRAADAAVRVMETEVRVEKETNGIVKRPENEVGGIATAVAETSEDEDEGGVNLDA